MKELCMVLITYKVMVNLDLTTLVAIFPSRILELFGHYILDEVAIGFLNDIYFYLGAVVLLKLSEKYPTCKMFLMFLTLIT
jgi:hypothetical protein